MGKSRAPAPPDPRDTSAASTSTNLATAIGNSFLTNVNEVTPYGTRTFTPTGSYTVNDPYSGVNMDVPRFTVETQLSPHGQRLQDLTNQTETNLAGLAADQSGFLRDYTGQPFQYNPGQHEEWALGIYSGLNNPEIDRQRETLRSRLINQGITQGSEAWNREMGRFDTSQMDSRNRFLLDSYNTGMQTALTERNQPLNEIIGLMSGSQVQQPNFQTGVNVNPAPTTDNASIIANNYNQQLAAWQQNQAATGAMLGGLGNVAGGLFMLSDERAKEDKKKIAETEDGLGIYSYRYKGSPTTQIGLMAQEVKKKKPNAVATRPDGLMMVNYEKATA